MCYYTRFYVFVNPFYSVTNAGYSRTVETAPVAYHFCMVYYSGYQIMFKIISMLIQAMYNIKKLPPSAIIQTAAYNLCL